MKAVKIKDRFIGDGYPAYIIAEMSGNHAGSIERAKEIIRAAKAAGADCIKIQTYTPDTLTIDCHNEYFDVKNGTWEGENLYSLYGKAFTPWEWQKELKEEADRIGIDFFSTPFDKTSVDFLEEMGVEFYKIASFEMIDLPLLEYVASKGKPIIMSTGMATLEEIREAVETVHSAGNAQLVLMKCSSAYPAIPEDMHLKTIVDMKERFQIPVGLSDHSMGSMSATLAVALGGNVIEKHFCLGREIENPDASFSMTPEEFSQMVRDIRNAEAAIGVPTYGVSAQEESSMVFRRSVFVIKDMEAGEAFTEENTRIIRPGYGVKPKYLKDILGMTSSQAIQRGTPFTFDLTRPGKILFLTNNENTNPLYQWLCEKEGREQVLRFTNKLSLEIVEALKPSFMISYNYRHIVKEDVINYMQGRIINLHTSYLPYNRGSSPNFFSFLEDTPKGITIHQLDKGLDTGAILVQKELTFDEEQETFASSYEKLIQEMYRLFTESWEAIKNGNIKPVSQQGEGTYHVMKDLQAYREKCDFSWNDRIADYKERLEGHDYEYGRKRDIPAGKKNISYLP